jgi:probable F420-dependent oxidoreductase
MSGKAPVLISSIGYLKIEDSLEVAKKAEAVGFGGVAMADHLFMPYTKPGEYPYSADGNPPFPLDIPWPDAWVLASAVASITTTVEILTSVYILPMRHPLVVARAAGTAAIIAGGRLTMGVGVGWLKEEFDALGVDFSKRGAIADESIAALRALWGEGPVTFDGRFFKFGPLYLEPSPSVPIPIVVGGTSDAALRRAVKLGDGYIVPHMASREEMLAAVGRVQAAVAEAGRDEFRTFMVCLAGRDSVDDLCRYAEAGVDAMLVQPWNDSSNTLEDRFRDIDDFWAQTAEPMYERLGFPLPRR